MREWTWVQLGNARHASGCAAGFGGVDNSKWVMGEGVEEKKIRKEKRPLP